MFKIFKLLSTLFFSIPAYSEIETDLTNALNGTEITYTYSEGMSFNVKFEEAGISYRNLAGSKPEKWWGPFPYKAVETENGEYLAAWFEEGYGDYITLLINFDTKTLFGSGTMPGKRFHFEKAEITNIKR